MHQKILALLAPDRTDSGFIAFLKELVAFGYKNALSCLFPVYIFVMLAVSHFIHIPGLYRYDLLLILCIAMQVFMYFSGLETFNEVKVICLFHLLGVCMEIYKVNHHCWAYTEHGYTKVFGVPLYSGFMYASVASYICQGWRYMNIKMVNWPSKIIAYTIGAAIYINFFTDLYLPDARVLIGAAVLISFFKTKVYFITNGNQRRMPMILAYFLIGIFIWFAENIATFLGAWKYAYQHDGWKMVHFQKLTSWYLLIIVTMIIVAQLKFAQEEILLHEKEEEVLEEHPAKA